MALGMYRKVRCSYIQQVTLKKADQKEPRPMSQSLPKCLHFAFCNSWADFAFLIVWFEAELDVSGRQCWRVGAGKAWKLFVLFSFFLFHLCFSCSDSESESVESLAQAALTLLQSFPERHELMFLVIWINWTFSTAQTGACRTGPALFNVGYCGT